MIAFSTEKQPVLEQQEICFHFQLLKLRKIRGKISWNKLVKISDESNLCKNWVEPAGR